MAPALTRHAQRKAHVIPLLLRPYDHFHAAFSDLQALPRNSVPVTLWPDRDAAFADIVEGIRLAAAPARTSPVSLLRSPGRWGNLSAAVVEIESGDDPRDGARALWARASALLEASKA